MHAESGKVILQVRMSMATFKFPTPYQAISSFSRTSTLR